MGDLLIYLDPCLYIPQGATSQERACDRARILADLWQYAQEINNRGGGWHAVVGVPPGMELTPQWREE